jgi:hypothetical protein
MEWSEAGGMSVADEPRGLRGRALLAGNWFRGVAVPSLSGQSGTASLRCGIRFAARRLRKLDCWAVHNVHTLPSGLGRTATRLGMVEVFGGVACFRGPGVRFESHLGHSVSAGQGPFGASGCAQIFFYGTLRGPLLLAAVVGPDGSISLGSATTLGLLLLHGRSGPGRHDLLGLGEKDFRLIACRFLRGLRGVVLGLLLDQRERRF